MKRANTMSTITVELITKMKTKFTSSNAEKTNGFISPQMSHNFHTFGGSPLEAYLRTAGSRTTTGSLSSSFHQLSHEDTFYFGELLKQLEDS